MILIALAEGTWHVWLAVSAVITLGNVGYLKSKKECQRTDHRTLKSCFWFPLQKSRLAMVAL